MEERINIMTLTLCVSMTYPEIGFSMPRKKSESERIRVRPLNVHVACLDRGSSGYVRIFEKYGSVSYDFRTTTQFISRSVDYFSKVNKESFQLKKIKSRKIKLVCANRYRKKVNKKLMFVIFCRFKVLLNRIFKMAF